MARPPSVIGARPDYDGRLARLIDLLGPGEDFAWVIALPSGEVFSSDEPRDTTLGVRLLDWELLRGPINQLTLARAYVSGHVELTVDGDPADVFDLRDRIPSGLGVRQAARLVGELALVDPVRANRTAIERHYDTDHSQLQFLDTDYHLYSSLIFAGEDRTLEQAALAKLERMHERLGLKAGDHILDVGAGWGALTRYCAPLDIKVTSLTLTEASADYIRAELPGSDVIVEDLLDHRRWQAYDHVVIFGVIEHLPTYARVCERVWDALKEDGKLYLDGSATREKYAGSAVTRHFTWAGPHSCLALPDLLQELIFHGFDVESVVNETEDYRQTMRQWGERLDAQRPEIARGFGDDTYRQYRLYLWGGSHAFASDRLQAYSLVARRGEKPGPRPGLSRRAAHFLASLRR